MASHLTPWIDPPAELTLTRGDVHLWRFRLDLPVAELDDLRGVLRPDELARADRLRDPVNAARFVAARGRLRQTLARYLGCLSEEVSFVYGEQGKPRLVGPAGNKLRFNLSHAGLWGVTAVVERFEVGVDLEKVDAQLDYVKVAASYFSAEEAAALEQYQVERRRRGFYRLWTCKEARLKGSGFGFHCSSVSDNSGKTWQTRLFVVDRGYLGAFAVAGEVLSVCKWQSF